MKKEIIFLGAIFALFFLTSCTSNMTVVPKAFSGSAEIFKINDEGTVEVKGYDMKEQPMHWVFVECNNRIRGCYMRCQGPKNICQSIATKSGLKNENVLKRPPGKNQFFDGFFGK
jgi:hypothetical protein